MRNLSAEEKAFIWLDAFPLPLGEKNALLKAAGSAARFRRLFRRVARGGESAAGTVRKRKRGFEKRR